MDAVLLYMLEMNRDVKWEDEIYIMTLMMEVKGSSRCLSVKLENNFFHKRWIFQEIYRAMHSSHFTFSAPLIVPCNKERSLTIEREIWCHVVELSCINETKYFFFFFSLNRGEEMVKLEGIWKSIFCLKSFNVIFLHYWLMKMIILE